LTVFIGFYGFSGIKDTPLLKAFLGISFMIIITYVGFLTFGNWNDQALNALFDKIEKLETYKSIFNNIQDSVLILEDGNISLTNEKFQQVFKM
jgi:hypothetical protein